MKIGLASGLGFLIPLFAASALYGQGSDELFLTGLRERRLFELAEAYCQQQLQHSELPDAKRVQLVIQRILTRTEWARQTPPPQRDARFDAAREAGEEFGRTYPASPRLVLVETQSALVLVAQGELERQEADLLAQGNPQLESARRHLRQGIRALEGLESKVAPRAPRRGGEEELSAEQIDELRRQIRFQLARALRNQGLCYGPESDDRASALTQALERLAPLIDLSAADELTWRGRIDQIECLRLLGRRSQAAQALAELLQNKPPPKILLLAAAEKIRLLLAGGELEAAVAEPDKGRLAAGVSSAELDFAHFEVYLAALVDAHRRQDRAAITRWEERAMRQVEQLQQEHGPYWMRRAETLLAGKVGGEGGGSLAALRRSAESFYRGGLLDEALATYDRAAEQAREAGQQAEAFDLDFTAAAIEREREHGPQAIERFHRLALASSTHPRASEAHLLAALGCAEQVRAATPAERSLWLDRYEKLLGEHVDRWPKSETAAEARLWQGNLKQSRRDWPGAIEAFRGIEARHRQYEAAVRGAGQCYEEWLATFSETSSERAQLAAEAADYFMAVVRREGAAWPEHFNALTRHAALLAARLRLRHQPQRASEIEKLLAATLAGGADVPDAWMADARALLVQALAFQEKRREAAAVLGDLASASPTGLAGLVGALASLAENASPATRQELDGLLKQAITLAEPIRPRLSASEARGVDLAHARLLSRAGRRQEALTLLTALAERWPQDIPVLQARAEVLGQSESPASLRDALRVWREIETRTLRAEARWFQTRYAQADLNARLGDFQAALKIIRLTAVQHPELGGADWKARFDQLEKRCQAAPAMRDAKKEKTGKEKE